MKYFGFCKYIINISLNINQWRCSFSCKCFPKNYSLLLLFLECHFTVILEILCQVENNKPFIPPAKDFNQVNIHSRLNGNYFYWRSLSEQNLLIYFFRDSKKVVLIFKVLVFWHCRQTSWKEKQGASVVKVPHEAPQ